MPPLYFVNVSIHVLAAMVWLGGMLFLGIVGAPVLRSIEPPELRQRLFHLLGLRFRAVGWIATAVLVVTGVTNLHYRGLLTWAVLGTPEFWSTAMGHTLAVKLGAVTMLIAGSAVHDFVLGPRAGLAVPGSAEALRSRRSAARLAQWNALVAIVLLLAAVRLARGG